MMKHNYQFTIAIFEGQTGTILRYLITGKCTVVQTCICDTMKGKNTHNQPSCVRVIVATFISPLYNDQY